MKIIKRSQKVSIHKQELFGSIGTAGAETLAEHGHGGKASAGEHPHQHKHTQADNINIDDICFMLESIVSKNKIQI